MLGDTSDLAVFYGPDFALPCIRTRQDDALATTHFMGILGERDVDALSGYTTNTERILSHPTTTVALLEGDRLQIQTSSGAEYYRVLSTSRRIGDGAESIATLSHVPAP